MDNKMMIALFAVIFIALGFQGFWIFKDAERRGMNKWLWGIFGLLNTPTNLLIYLIVSRTIVKSKECLACGHKNSKRASYCEVCGQALPEPQEHA